MRDELPADLTIRFAQQNQPWTVPYSYGVLRAESVGFVPHVLASHAALHAAKTVGKLAAVFERLDHRTEAIRDDERREVAAMAADLLVIALRFANLYGFDLADELERRVEEKNGVPLRPR